MKVNRICAALLTAGLVYSAPSSAFVLSFEGVDDGATVMNFYNGGTDSNGNSGPNNYGVAFGAGAFVLTGGISQGYSNNPSPTSIMYMPADLIIVMNMANGFTTFSFFYTSATTGTVKVYDDLDGSGVEIGSSSLIVQNTEGGCTDSAFCHWTKVETTLLGTGKSVTFTVDDLSLTGFDDIALTPACVANCNNVPEPTTLAVLGLGLAGLWFGRRQRI